MFGKGEAALVVSSRSMKRNNADGDSPGTVSVLNGATCNGTTTTGCGGPSRTIAAGRSPLLAVVDPRTGAVYVSDTSSASVTVLNGRRCSASVTSGCGRPSRARAVGSQRFGLAVNPRTRTVYVTQLFQAGSMALLKSGQH